MGPVHSNANSTPWGTYSPAAITGLENIETHKQSLSNQVPIHCWVERVHVQVKCLAQGHRATPWQPRPPRPRDPKWRVEATAPRRNAYIWRIYSDKGTLGMVNGRELVVLSGSFTSHSMSVRRCRLRGHASHDRYIVSNVEGWKRNLRKPLPQRASTPPPGMTGAHATTALWIPKSHCRW